MHDYERIKNLTAELIMNKETDIMSKWKQEIRAVLMQVRDQFIEWVDTFT
jgi:hypothetical protein